MVTASGAPLEPLLKDPLAPLTARAVLEADKDWVEPDTECRACRVCALRPRANAAQYSPKVYCTMNMRDSSEKSMPVGKERAGVV